jgi:hypothetical protein
VLRLRKQGLTLPEIGAKLGCSVAKLSRVLRDGGAPHAPLGRPTRPPKAGDGRSHWTPERRAAQAKRMGKLLVKARAAKLRKQLLLKDQAQAEQSNHDARG